MQAAYYTRNRTFELREGTRPEPGPGEVTLRVAYCGICGTDVGIFKGKMDARVGAEQILGHEASARVEQVGEGVSDLQPGDPVTVMPLHARGDDPIRRAGLEHICESLDFIGIDAPGAFQTFWKVPAHLVFKLPETVSLQHAAMVEPIAVACHDIRLSGAQAGEYAVVLGGGPIGAFIALVGKARGLRVLVSELNPFRIQLLNELGVETLDPRETDLPTYVKKQTGGAGADVVFEVTGHPSGIEMATRLPKARGVIMVVGIFAEPPKVDLFQFFWRELQMRGARVYEREDYAKAIEMVTSGALPLDRMISRVLPLDKIQEGVEAMEAGGENMKILMELAS
jgi:(R,R)-butanediol dehydrogenase / meso-butanediol dehydrogenase / diacetyl reductase